MALQTRFLVPLVSNDGQSFPESKFDELETQIILQLGGFQKESEIKGGWKADDGRLMTDAALTPYRVTVFDIPILWKLYQFLQRICTDFQQEALYLEVSNHVELVYPQQQGGA